MKTWTQRKGIMCVSGALVAVAGGFMLAGLVFAADSGWPQFLGPRRDNRSDDTGLLKQWPKEGPPLVWKNSAIGEGWSSCAVTSDAIYITGNIGNNTMLSRLDMQGKEKWKMVQGPKCSHSKYPGTRSTPTVDGDYVYVIGGDGLVTCHKVADGAVVWSRDMLKDLAGEPHKWLYTESPLMLGDKLIVTPGGSNGIVALDKTTGKNVWKSDVAIIAGYSSCIAITQKDSTIIVNGSQSGLIMVDAQTGKKVGSNPWPGPKSQNIPTPAYADGYIFWAVGYTKGGICLKADRVDGKWTFTEVWKSNDIDCMIGGYVIHEGYIYGNHGSGVTCIELKTGKTMWKNPGVGKGSITFADGMLYMFGDSSGKAGLAPCSPEKLKLTGSFSVAGKDNSWAYPVVTGGRLYLRYDANLYCYDVKAK